MKVLICDDDTYALEQLREYVLYYMEQHSIACELTVSESSKKIMRGRESFDLAFLDIQMDEVDGIALAKELRRRNGKLALFFITNFEEYQDDAMDLRAFRFLPKPFDSQRLFAGLDKAMEYIDGAYINVMLNSNGIYKRFAADDILYVRRDNRKVILTAKNGIFAAKESFGGLCGRLPVRYFFLVHNSFIINLHYVKTYCYSELTMVNGERISIASRKQAAFRKFWFEYLRRR